uniref:Ig-like domain-containing protein n=1 Tax=Oreochromis aureus TaxID=47969 RepID=A0A668SLF3_OREAU
MSITVLSGVSAITVTIPQSQYEYARGDNITLPCSFTTTTPINSRTLVVITWSSLTQQTVIDEVVIATYYHGPAPTTDIDTDYEGRVSMDVDVTQGKANLKLSSISLADNKDFECRVQIPVDKKGKQTDKQKWVCLLAAPSKPICKIQGTAEYHQNISLICVSEEGSPPPTYSWERRDVTNNPVPHDPSTTDSKKHIDPGNLCHITGIGLHKLFRFISIYSTQLTKFFTAYLILGITHMQHFYLSTCSLKRWTGRQTHDTLNQLAGG